MIKRKLLTALLVATATFPLLQEKTEAAEFRSGVEVLIGADEVLDEDVYAVGGSIIVDGIINGDLLAAGQSIEVNGAVNGDLIVAARAISVSGDVEDDVRAAGAELQFQSSVGEDLIVSGYQIDVGPEAMIGQDLVANANTLILDGNIEGDLDLDAFEATISGNIEGNVRAEVEDEFIFSPESTIGGSLNYTGPNELDLPPGIAGDVTQELPMVDLLGIEYAITTITLIVSKIIEQTKWFIGTLLVGLVLIWLFPRTINNVQDILPESPLKSLGLGVLVLPLLPILLLIGMIAILSVIGSSAFSLIAIPGTVYAALLLLAKPVVAMSVGAYMALRIGKKQEATPIGALAIGAGILAVAGIIPYVDTLVGWLTLLAGFGMWLLFFLRRYREARAAQSA